MCSEEDKDFEYLVSLTEVIRSPAIRAKVKAQLEAAPAYFKSIPASTTGKFHPDYTLGYGGLVRHTISVVRFALILCELQYVRANSKQRDRILAACFLHDICKKGTSDLPDAVSYEDHANLAARRVDDGSEDFKAISRLISVHMGEWGRNRPGNMHEFVVSLADHLASRKEVKINL